MILNVNTQMYFLLVIRGKCMLFSINEMQSEIC